jgi:hypothetical protein
MRAAALLLALLAGCASTVRSPQSDAARLALFDCHAQKAGELDDRQSDAATIGRAVHRACLGEANAAAASTMSTWASPAFRDSYAAEFMRGASAHATQAVLEARARR